MRTPIFQLLYRSHAVSEFQDSDCQKILSTSRKFNSENDITGLLIYRNRSFMQLLEGPEKTVRSLYARIQNDQRHRDCTTLIESTSSERFYTDWSMAFVDGAKASGSVSQIFDLIDKVTEGAPSNSGLLLPVLRKFQGYSAEIETK